MSLVKISIVTICLNAEKTIKETMASVETQELAPNIEHLFVDGGSTDGTVELIEAYKQKVNYPVSWVSEKDQGISDAFNKGAVRASGEYIQYLNADDSLFDSNVLRNIWSWVESKKFPVWVVGDVALKDARGEVHVQKRKRVPSCVGLAFRDQIPHPSVFLNRQVLLDAGKFDVGYKIAMDYELWVRMCHLGYSISYCPIVVTLFAAGGVSSELSSVHLNEVVSIKRLARSKTWLKLLGWLYDRYGA